MAFLPQPQEEGSAEEDTTIDVHTTSGTPIRYLPLDHLYSATSPCRVTASGSSNVMSKKVKARKLNLNHNNDNFNDNDNDPPPQLDHNHHNNSNKKTTQTTPFLLLPKPPLKHVYCRRRKRHSSRAASYYDSLLGRVENGSGVKEPEEESGDSERRLIKKRRIGSTELGKLGVDLSTLGNLDGPRLRECRIQFGNSGNAGSNKCGSLEKFPKLIPESRTLKRWVG